MIQNGEQMWHMQHIIHIIFYWLCVANNLGEKVTWCYSKPQFHRHNRRHKLCGILLYFIIQFIELYRFFLMVITLFRFIFDNSWNGMMQTTYLWATLQPPTPACFYCYRRGALLCLSPGLLCDGEYDCSDRSDEHNCASRIGRGTDPPLQEKDIYDVIRLLCDYSM